MNNANVDLSTPETSAPLGAYQKTIKPGQVITSLYAKEIVKKGKKGRPLVCRTTANGP